MICDRPDVPCHPCHTDRAGVGGTVAGSVEPDQSHTGVGRESAPEIQLEPRPRSAVEVDDRGAGGVAAFVDRDHTGAAPVRDDDEGGFGGHSCHYPLADATS